MIYGESLVDKCANDLKLRVFDSILGVFDYIVTISFGYILYCVCFKLFCKVCVCVFFYM